MLFSFCRTSTKEQSNTKEDIHEYEAVRIKFPSSIKALETDKLQNKMEEIDLVDCTAYGEVRNVSVRKVDIKDDDIQKVYDTVQ